MEKLLYSPKAHLASHQLRHQVFYRGVSTQSPPYQRHYSQLISRADPLGGYHSCSGEQDAVPNLLSKQHQDHGMWGEENMDTALSHLQLKPSQFSVLRQPDPFLMETRNDHIPTFQNMFHPKT